VLAGREGEKTVLRPGQGRGGKGGVVIDVGSRKGCSISKRETSGRRKRGEIIFSLRGGGEGNKGLFSDQRRGILSRREYLVLRGKETFLGKGNSELGDGGGGVFSSH